jgi:hypothetical protein
MVISIRNGSLRSPFLIEFSGSCGSTVVVRQPSCHTSLG